MTDKHPLDAHARAIDDLFKTRRWNTYDVAAAVLRVELHRTIWQDEFNAAREAYERGRVRGLDEVDAIYEALKAAMAARIKALGLD